MGDPVIKDEAQYEKELSDFERKEIARDRAERMESEEDDENSEFEALAMKMEEEMRSWTTQAVMNEILAKPTIPRVVVFCSFLDALRNAAKALAREKIDA